MKIPKIVLETIYQIGFVQLAHNTRTFQSAAIAALLKTRGQSEGQERDSSRTVYHCSGKTLCKMQEKRKTADGVFGPQLNKKAITLKERPETLAIMCMRATSTSALKRSLGSLNNTVIYPERRPLLDHSLRHKHILVGHGRVDPAKLDPALD